MTKEIFISSTPHETRLAIVEDEQLVEIHYERENEYTLAGSMYKGKVTRVLPGMQSAFVDVGLERDAFLYVTDFLEEQDDSGEFERTALPAAGRAPLHAAPQEQTADDSAEIGTDAVEAAPGAEGESSEEGGAGSRRWRGRRGRRRGGRERAAGEGAATKSEAQPAESKRTGHTIEINSDGDDFVTATESPDWETPAQYEHAPEEPSDDWHAPIGAGQAQFESAPEPAHVEEAEPEAPRAARGGRGLKAAAPSFVLPGESLSKYSGGKSAAGQESKSSAPARTPSARPSTMIETPITWDGSLVLPGESLSRHRSAKSQPVAQHAAEPEAKPTEPVEEEIDEDELIEQSEAEIHEAAHRQDDSLVAEHSLDTVEETAEAPEEEEPHNASASHSVDPNPPSEFRLPWFGSKSATEEHDPHTGTTPEDAARRKQAHDTAHEFTSHAQPPVEVFPGVPDFVEDEADAEHTGQRHNFSPGAGGQVEEEVIDEEEYDFEPLRGHGEEHDSEDLVEETLEQQMEGADIGEFVRDTYVNERTSFVYDSETDEEGEEEDGADALAETEGEPATAQTPATDAAPRQRRGRRGRRGQGEKSGRADRQVADQPRVDRQAEQPREERQPERRDDRRGGGRRGGTGGNRRQSAQTMSLPAITELLKPGQEILVQIAKEPIAKKGARITSHIALPGRFLVYMPTVNHIGVSRKIASDEERQRLKRILLSEKAEAGGGFIVRTAAGGATEQELRSDIRFLINLWTEIKQRSENAKPPALIYHDLNLVERILRDQVTDRFSAIWVDSEAEYERVLRFLNRFQPSLVRHVKLYTKETPLFEQFGIQEEVNKALKSKVWLKSGGSIVINQTEALVAIDINTGKYVGKTARLEDTILRTNLDAIPEIVRQIRLRDLGGIIVIDFIDMDERRNRHKVMAALEEQLKTDRAPSKVLQFNDFGLVAITRKRVKQSLERTLSMPCITCTGTGMVKNPTTVCNEIYVELRKMHRHLERNDILLRVHPEVVKQLKANGSRWLQDMEEMAGKTIIIKSDATLHPEQFDIH